MADEAKVKQASPEKASAKKGKKSARQKKTPAAKKAPVKEEEKKQKGKKGAKEKQASADKAQDQEEETKSPTAKNSPEQKEEKKEPEIKFAKPKKTPAAKPTKKKPRKKADEKENEVPSDSTAETESSGGLTGDKATIYNYMKSQNRPYSGLNVYDNLRGAIKKNRVIEILDQLSSEKYLNLKDFGKFRTYLVNQDVFPVVDDAQIALLDEEIAGKREAIAEQKEEIKQMTEQHKKLKSVPKLADVQAQICALEEENSKLREKIDKFEAGELQPISMELMTGAKDSLEKMGLQARKRKRWCMNIVYDFAEMMEIKPAALIAKWDLEE